ncbi:hypothetical protein DW1_2277 [Proteiniborus sp. DW1]|nr:hypothetical protein DW1_2277 [Proteiniborus sp. DW1]
MNIFGKLGILNIIFILGVWTLSFYCLVLLIRLVQKGIKALDIYIKKIVITTKYDSSGSYFLSNNCIPLLY